MAQVASEPTIGAESAGLDLEGAAVEGRSPAQLFWRRFRKDRYAIAGATFIVLLAFLAWPGALILSKVLHHGPNQHFIYTGTTESGLPLGPSKHFWFGHDQLGQDLFIRIIYGARTSMEVAIVATGISVIIGVALGMVAGFPLVILIIAFANWTYIARIVRGQVLSLREKEFVESSYATGASDMRIMFREILPNVAMPIIVYSSLVIPANILFEAALSFLGVGVPILTPSWGKMISDATTGGLYQVAWWYMVFPGLFLFLTTFAFNLLGDGLRDALDPKTAK
jgi:peptide/nickel transport system permease protein